MFHPLAELVGSKGDEKFHPRGKKILPWRSPSAITVLSVYSEAAPSPSRSAGGEKLSRVSGILPAETPP
jgi:hypothetical protein